MAGVQTPSRRTVFVHGRGRSGATAWTLQAAEADPQDIFLERIRVADQPERDADRVIETLGGRGHLVAHSYGTVMTSEALQNGATEYVDDVVVLGSPGMGVDSVADLGLPGDHVFAGMDDDDILLKAELIEDVLAPDPIPGVDFNVVHGPSTTTEEFGATVIATGGVDHHGDYFSYENGKPVDTLITAAAVATGEYDEVVTA